MPDLIDEIQDKYEERCRIYSAMIEITHNCMCDCSHCFLIKN